MVGYLLVGIISLITGGCLGVMAISILIVGSRSDNDLGEEQYK